MRTCRSTTNTDGSLLLQCRPVLNLNSSMYHNGVVSVHGAYMYLTALSTWASAVVFPPKLSLWYNSILSRRLKPSEEQLVANDQRHFTTKQHIDFPSSSKNPECGPARKVSSSRVLSLQGAERYDETMGFVLPSYYIAFRVIPNCTMTRLSSHAQWSANHRLFRCH